LSLCQHPSFDHADLSPNQVAKLMSNLLSDLPSDSPTLDATQRQALIAATQAKYGNEIVAPILQRVFPSLRYGQAFICLYLNLTHNLFPQSSAWHIPRSDFDSAWARDNE
jgi:hypothetical protein